LVPWLKVTADGEPYLEGLRCSACGAVFLDVRRHCAGCGARDKLEPSRLSERGRLVVFSIVHRSFPGIPVPYVSAIVEVDGGGTVKANLVGVVPDPRAIVVGMAVDLVFDETTQTDDDGTRYLMYSFRPVEDAR
jgi:uncharacterized OB-fold protein